MVDMKETTTNDEENTVICYQGWQDDRWWHHGSSERRLQSQATSRRKRNLKGQRLPAERQRRQNHPTGALRQWSEVVIYERVAAQFDEQAQKQRGTTPHQRRELQKHAADYTAELSEACDSDLK